MTTVRGFGLRTDILYFGYHLAVEEAVIGIYI